MYRPIYRAVFGANWTKNKRYTHTAYTLFICDYGQWTSDHFWWWWSPPSNNGTSGLQCVLSLFSVFFFVWLSFFCFVLFQFWLRVPAERPSHFIHQSEYISYTQCVVITYTECDWHCSDLNVSINACCLDASIRITVGWICCSCDGKYPKRKSPRLCQFDVRLAWKYRMRGKEIERKTYWIRSRWAKTILRSRKENKIKRKWNVNINDNKGKGNGNGKSFIAESEFIDIDKEFPTNFKILLVAMWDHQIQ